MVKNRKGEESADCPVTLHQRYVVTVEDLSHEAQGPDLQARRLSTGPHLDLASCFVVHRVVLGCGQHAW